MQFVAMLYIVPWVRSPLTLEAAAVDLALQKDLIRYCIVDPAVGSAARDVLGRHLWYLTPELAVFGLFSNSFSIEDKENAAAKILLHPPNLRKGKPIFPTVLTMDSSLVDFVNGRSWTPFHILGFSGDWLRKPCSEWPQQREFQRMAEVLKGLECVNDPAERSVKLIEDFARKVSNG